MLILFIFLRNICDLVIITNFLQPTSIHICNHPEQMLQSPRTDVAICILYTFFCNRCTHMLRNSMSSYKCTLYVMKVAIMFAPIFILVCRQCCNRYTYMVAIRCTHCLQFGKTHFKEPFFI